ncbi:serine/threonine-protein phosphatase, partial [Streptomyces sp. NPDC004011]
MALRPWRDFRRSWQPGHAPALLVIPLGLIVAVCAVDLLTPPHIHLGPLLVAAPAITVAFAGARVTA